MSKRFMLVFLVFVAVFVGLFMISSRDAGAPEDEAVEPTSHTVGEGTGGVTLIEYGDFQCIGCYNYYPLVKQIKEKYGDQITFQFRHFPIISSHPNAMAAHRAAEAAARQGKFFEMHDLLFEQQPVWKTSTRAASDFEGYAEQLELDMDQYRQDVNSKEANRAIQADLKAGNDIGVNSTPTFVLNGQKIEEVPRDLDGFSALIDKAIQENAQE